MRIKRHILIWIPAMMLALFVFVSIMVFSFSDHTGPETLGFNQKIVGFAGWGSIFFVIFFIQGYNATPKAYRNFVMRVLIVCLGLLVFVVTFVDKATTWFSRISFMVVLLYAGRDLWKKWPRQPTSDFIEQNNSKKRTRTT